MYAVGGVMGVRIESSRGSALMYAAEGLLADEGHAPYGLRGRVADGKTRLAEAGVFRVGRAGLTGDAAEVMMTVRGGVVEEVVLLLGP